LRIPIVYTNHTRYDLYAQAYLPIMPEEMSQGILQAYMPSFCEGVDFVITPSKGMETVLRQLNVKKHIEVVPNGVELKPFIEAEPLRGLDFGYTTDDLLLVYSGRIAVEKNLPFLLRSFKGISQAVPNLHLLLLGSGIQSYEEEIRALILELELGHRVRLTGRIPYEQLPAYLAMCDIFVTASVTEVHPLSVIEAMAAGLPVMGIQSVGVGDTLEDGVSGFLASYDQPAFTAKLTRLCLDRDLRDRMGAAARLTSRKYEIEATVRIMSGHYEALVRESRPRKGSWSVRLRGMLERLLA
jgi:glycosyltransferase involved in cell wall biosynthesis